MLITNAIPLINGQFNALSDITVVNGIITDIAIASGAAGDIDCGGKYIAAGYIDIHTHGGGGYDVMDASLEAITAISKYHLSTGTTTYAPTTLTASISDTLKALANLQAYNNPNYARLLGAHLEGPYISAKAAGAHPPKLILNPNPDNTQWIWDNAESVSRITIAPDNSGTPYICRGCKANKIQVSLGHDASIDDEIYAAIAEGASSVTHMYNCTSRPSRRSTPRKHLGLTEIGLISDKLVCEVIADNRHVPNELFGMIYRLKGWQGIALISDSLSVSGMGQGEFYLGSGDSKQKLLVSDGVATLPELNTYAGSVTPVSAMVVNLHNTLGIPLNECVNMATLSPARLLDLCDRGDIAVGKLADFNVLNADGSIDMTILNGNVVKI